MIRYFKFFYSLLLGAALAGCINEDLPECPNNYRLRIVFDRNMLYADAFATQVRSVDIKVFDHATGREVWHHTDSGKALSNDSYTVDMPLLPGSYDILCWGGMAEGNSFGYAVPSGDKLSHNGVKLLTGEEDESDLRLNDLFHGLLTNVEFIDNNTINSAEPQNVTLHLTKNTNRLNVILLNLDGSEMDPDGFSISVKSKNGFMDYDNSVGTGNPILYQPWAVTPVGMELPGSAGTVRSGLSAEFSIGRLARECQGRIDVTRRSDGKNIISIALESNLLLYKGEFHSHMDDQEYLDRQDDYTITFILDQNNNWNKGAMIYVNQWATLPVQFQEW